MTRKRPVFPKKAVITAGMPYGNKELHFGHIGGVFVHADTYARFLRDRIGKDNVIFVSGTDCYGSPIVASYQKALDEGTFSGSISDFVNSNHLKQKEVLEQYQISLNLYGTSGLGRSGEVHERISKEVFDKLYSLGCLKKMSSPQFYDSEQDMFLNGRQVVGRCPIQGCKSEKAYADECSLGHQYSPSELIAPKSILSGTKPSLVDVENWYFDLEAYGEALQKRNEYLREHTNHRSYLLNTIEEFLRPPMIYVKRKDIEANTELLASLPPHTIIDEEHKSSLALVFNNLQEREKAQNTLMSLNIRYRTGKTLVPFRLTGNVEWGVPVPEKEGLSNLTFWVWPESLWAPFSFVETYLESIGQPEGSWHQWFFSDDTKVYQFIGEDNIYFYGVAEMGMFMALEEMTPTANLPHLIANNHLLFLDKKASSSGKIKPPMAGDLLNHYTAEQLRMHFLSLGLAKKSVSFSPQPYMKEADRHGKDIVLKDGNLLTNVLNRIARSCFYTAQTHFDGRIPQGSVSADVLAESHEAVLEYEMAMYNHEFHSVIYILDSYIRRMNKYWSNKMREAKDSDDMNLRKQVLIDGFHALRTSLLLVHPIAPDGCERVRLYLRANEDMYNWKFYDKTIDYFIDENRELKYLEPKVDFFHKHESQFV